MTTSPKIATKRTFRSGKVIVAQARVWSTDPLHDVHVGPVTMCLNTVAEFLPSGTSTDPIDLFVWDGDQYVSRQSGRMLYVK